MSDQGSKRTPPLTPLRALRVRLCPLRRVQGGEPEINWVGVVESLEKGLELAREHGESELEAEMVRLLEMARFRVWIEEPNPLAREGDKCDWSTIRCRIVEKWKN